MINLTIFGKDKTKQVSNMNDSVLLDNKNKLLNQEQITKKFDEIAQTIGGQNFSSYKLETI